MIAQPYNKNSVEGDYVMCADSRAVWSIRCVAQSALSLLFAVFLFSSVAFSDGLKSTVCHFPNAGDGQTITIDMSAVQAHLINHGDYVGICPIPIGPDGAAIVIPGEIDVDIPAGALTGTVDIFIRRVSGQPGSLDVLYEIGPSGLTFDIPVQITVTYDSASLPATVVESDLLIADFTERMQPLLMTSVDTANRTVSGFTSHLSSYGMGSLESTGVNIDQFDSPATGWRVPIGDRNGLDLGNDLSLLEISNFQRFNYPKISFNSTGDPNDWYVATAFNKDRYANNGYHVEPSPVSNDVLDISSCADKGHTDPQSSKYSCKGSFHPGEDWNLIAENDEGQVVHAIADGIVLFKQSQNSSFGNIVVIGHKLESGEPVASVYAHLLAPSSLVVGSDVFKGNVVGRIGSAPSASPHLHFEIVKQNLLNIDSQGFVRIPVNRVLNRGWYWPGTDTNWISANYYEPSQFLKSRQQSGTAIYDEQRDGDIDYLANPLILDFEIGNNVISGSMFFLVPTDDFSTWTADFDIFDFTVPAGSQLVRVEYEYSGVSASPNTTTLSASWRILFGDFNNRCTLVTQSVLVPNSLPIIYDQCNGFPSSTINFPFSSGPLYQWDHGVSTGGSTLPIGGSWNYGLTFVVE